MSMTVEVLEDESRGRVSYAAVSIAFAALDPL
jgi:hypothetical protein